MSSRPSEYQIPPFVIPSKGASATASRDLIRQRRCPVSGPGPVTAPGPRRTDPAPGLGRRPRTPDPVPAVLRRTSTDRIYSGGGCMARPTMNREEGHSCYAGNLPVIRARELGKGWIGWLMLPAETGDFRESRWCVGPHASPAHRFSRRRDHENGSVYVCHSGNSDDTRQ